jgi:hypothetical protein
MFCKIFFCNKPMVVERKVSYSQCKQKMTSFRRQASSAKMTLLGGKLRALACHPTKRVNKDEDLTYLSTNIAINLTYSKQLVLL